MSCIIPKIPQANEENKNDDELNIIVSSQLQLKRDPNDKPLTKEVVLRRIRQRKRVNKFRSLLASLFSFAKNTTAVTGDIHDHTQNNTNVR